MRVRLRAGQRRRGHGGAEQRGGDEAAAVPWRPLRLQRMLTFNGVNSESNRVLDCGTNAHFQWYFMARRTFGGIFRFSHSFDAMKPIFPFLKSTIYSVSLYLSQASEILYMPNILKREKQFKALDKESDDTRFGSRLYTFLD